MESLCRPRPSSTCTCRHPNKCQFRQIPTAERRFCFRARGRSPASIRPWRPSIEHGCRDVASGFLRLLHVCCSAFPCLLRHTIKCDRTKADTSPVFRLFALFIMSFISQLSQAEAMPLMMAMPGRLEQLKRAYTTFCKLSARGNHDTAATYKQPIYQEFCDDAMAHQDLWFDVILDPGMGDMEVTYTHAEARRAYCIAWPLCSA